MSELSCIEPYENNWLEELGINIVRQKVENIEKGIFLGLQVNDILFIDSSHVVRPGGMYLLKFLKYYQY